jgi:hypothetical protein
MYKERVQLTTNLLMKLGYKFFATKLGITDEQLKMISIKLVKKMEDKDVGGFCSANYNMYGELFNINIRILIYTSDIGMLDVLAHEMVHAAQNLRGEFTFEDRWVRYFKWLPFVLKKERVRIHAGQILEDTPYFDMICEQEAFNKSRELTRQFLNFVDMLENNALITDSINIQPVEVECLF